MNNAEKRYLDNITSLHRIQVPRADRIITRLLLLFVVMLLVFLRFTPWMQTAYGDGSVSSLSPQNRIQAISALVEGQIQQWHVKEGDAVKAGQPIVTLIDANQSLIERLDAQLNAVQQQQNANLSAMRTTEQDLVRRKELLKEGLVSQRDVEQVQHVQRKV